MSINPPTNALIAIKLVIPKVIALNLWGIQTGGIIVVIHGRGIPKNPPVLRLLVQGKRMMF